MSNFINSIKKNKVGIILIIISSILVSLGQFFWKISKGKLGVILLIGFTFYGIGAILMIIAFKYGSFSVIHPMISTSYVFALLIGVIVLNEKLTIFKVTGVAFIMFGTALIGGGDD